MRSMRLAPGNCSKHISTSQAQHRNAACRRMRTAPVERTCCAHKSGITQCVQQMPSTVSISGLKAGIMWTLELKVLRMPHSLSRPLQQHPCTWRKALSTEI